MPNPSLQPITWDTARAAAFANVVSRRRKANGLSQEKLAYKADISKNQVHLIESGRTSGRVESPVLANPKLTTLIGLANALDVTLSQMLAEAGL